MNKPKKPALGRGLSALLKDAPDANQPVPPAITAPSANQNTNLVKIDHIQANPFQPRTDFEAEALQELAESIKLHGLIQPVTLRKLAPEQYQLISGERRTRAAAMAGLIEIPAYVRQANDQEMLEMALIENIQRQDLNAIEIALSYQRLLDECEIKMEELGERVGKSRSSVNNYLRLLKLPDQIQIALRDGLMSMGHARAIINIENPQKQLDIFTQIIEQDLSVRAVEELARALKESKPATSKNPKLPKTDFSSFEPSLNDLADKYDVQVKLRSKDTGGELVLIFHTKDELEKLLGQL